MTDEVVRLSLPGAFVDPAFRRCLVEAIGELEFVRNFDRLYGTTLMCRPTKRDMSMFVAHVHDVMYLRLPDEAIVRLRVKREQS